MHPGPLEHQVLSTLLNRDEPRNGDSCLYRNGNSRFGKDRLGTLMIRNTNTHQAQPWSCLHSDRAASPSEWLSASRATGKVRSGCAGWNGKRPQATRWRSDPASGKSTTTPVGGSEPCLGIPHRDPESAGCHRCRLSALGSDRRAVLPTDWKRLDSDLSASHGKNSSVFFLSYLQRDHAIDLSLTLHRSSAASPLPSANPAERT